MTTFSRTFFSQNAVEFIPLLVSISRHGPFPHFRQVFSSLWREFRSSFLDRIPRHFWWLFRAERARFPSQFRDNHHGFFRLFVIERRMLGFFIIIQNESFLPCILHILSFFCNWGIDKCCLELCLWIDELFSLWWMDWLHQHSLRREWAISGGRARGRFLSLSPPAFLLLTQIFRGDP